MPALHSSGKYRHRKTTPKQLSGQADKKEVNDENQVELLLR